MDEQKYGYAGFWIRAGASLIDTILIGLVTYPLLYYFYGAAYFDGGKSGFVSGPAEVLVGWVFPIAAVILFWIKKQATPGKMALSLKIVDAKTGKPISARQALIRYVGYIVSSMPLGLGLIWVAFDAKKQGWHDKMAGTLVITSKKSQ